MMRGTYGGVLAGLVDLVLTGLTGFSLIGGDVVSGPGSLISANVSSSCRMDLVQVFFLAVG